MREVKNQQELDMALSDKDNSPIRLAANTEQYIAPRTILPAVIIVDEGVNLRCYGNPIVSARDGSTIHAYENTKIILQKGGTAYVYGEGVTISDMGGGIVRC